MQAGCGGCEAWCSSHITPLMLSLCSMASLSDAHTPAHTHHAYRLPVLAPLRSQDHSLLPPTPPTTPTALPCCPSAGMAPATPWCPHTDPLWCCLFAQIVPLAVACTSTHSHQTFAAYTHNACHSAMPPPCRHGTSSTLLCPTRTPLDTNSLQAWQHSLLLTLLPTPIAHNNCCCSTAGMAPATP